MSFISQHIMSFVWVVVWCLTIASSLMVTLGFRFKFAPIKPQWAWIFAASWAIIIVFWFN